MSKIVFNANPPQELDHSGWSKHIRDTVQSPGSLDQMTETTAPWA